MSIPPFPEKPYAELTREVLEAELLVVIRHDAVTADRLRDLFDHSFGALHGAIKAGLFVPVGPAVAVYYGDPQATFDLEIGFPAMGAPTADIPTAAGVIRASAFPAGPAAVISHVGGFDGLGAAWQGLVAQAGGTPTGVWIEAYISDPSTTAPDQVRTDLVLPIR